jgi:hypothetical protein
MSATDDARSGDEAVTMFGSGMATVPAMTAISVVSSVSRSAEQLHARRAVPLEELWSW